MDDDPIAAMDDDPNDAEGAAQLVQRVMLVLGIGGINTLDFLFPILADVRARRVSLCGEGVLLAAVGTRSTAVLAELIAHGASVLEQSAPDSRGHVWTALALAAKMGDLATIDFLVMHCGAPLEQNPAVTPLIVAVVEGHVAAARRLVELGADVDCWRFRVVQYGGPPLYEAVVRSDYPMMSMLIDLGADPTVFNSDNAESAIDFAYDWDLAALDIMGEPADHLEYLARNALENVRQPNLDTEVLRLALPRVAMSTAKLDEALFDAAETGDWYRVRLLVNHGAGANSYRGSDSAQGRSSGATWRVKELIAHGAVHAGDALTRLVADARALPRALVNLELARLVLETEAIPTPDRAELGSLLNLLDDAAAREHLHLNDTLPMGRLLCAHGAQHTALTEMPALWMEPVALRYLFVQNVPV
ncbi:hypothetical protein JL720_13902 [Aureococcus anophagefferens]|nr:hypothetical protein JL720_13902 [Aureococcus anophagefferens]